VNGVSSHDFDCLFTDIVLYVLRITKLTVKIRFQHCNLVNCYHFVGSLCTVQFSYENVSRFDVLFVMCGHTFFKELFVVHNFTVRCVSINWSPKTTADNCRFFLQIDERHKHFCACLRETEGHFWTLVGTLLQIRLKFVFLAFWTLQNYQCYFARDMRILLFSFFSVSQDRFKVWRKI